MTDVDDYSDPRDYGPVREEPDFDALAYEEHCEDVHGGQACDCPVPSEAEIEAAWKASREAHEAEAHGGGPCDCVAPF